jgi:hypothetical protein
MYDTRSIKALRRVSLTINLWRIAWLKASKKAIESPKSRRKKRSKQSLQRRAKRGLRRVGSRPLDQARRNRSESLPQCDGKPRTTTTARTSVTSGGVGGVIVSFIADSLPTSAARLRVMPLRPQTFDEGAHQLPLLGPWHRGPYALRRQALAAILVKRH